jgi:hypothetical protein
LLKYAQRLLPTLPWTSLHGTHANASISKIRFPFGRSNHAVHLHSARLKLSARRKRNKCRRFLGMYACSPKSSRFRIRELRLMLVSSCVSRIAACSGVSPLSMPPFGMSHRPVPVARAKSIPLGVSIKAPQLNCTYGPVGYLTKSGWLRPLAIAVVQCCHILTLSSSRSTSRRYQNELSHR